ncbi:MAG: nuclear transport factor 2 family protein [Solirubrobacterales bacterium]
MISPDTLDVPDFLKVAYDFIRAFNEQDLDRFAGTLHPEIELHSGRGIRKGVDEARRWARRAPDGVQQTIVVEHAQPLSSGAHEVVVVAVVRRWCWEDGSPAGEEPLEWVFDLADGLVRRWRPYDGHGTAVTQL